MSSDIINTTIRELGIAATPLSGEQSREVIAAIKANLGVDVSKKWAWDEPAVSNAAVRNPDGWKLIPSFVSSSPCLLFENEAHEIWSISNGDDLLRILAEASGFEFYVTDNKANFLLCHNHHDFVVGWGSAQKWVLHLGDR